VHRHGELAVGEASVAVAASAAHRAEAFDAARHAIERLKHDVPIWKKEALVSGDARWVQGA
jgi:molybdopterin synthase catalytic subunit